MSFTRQSKDNQQPKLVWWPVSIQEPRDGGTAVIHKVEVQYEIVSESEKDALIDEGGDPGFLHRVVHDWKGFQEEDKTPIACTQASRDEFFEISWVKTGLLHGYFKAAVGGKRKNS